MPRPGSRPGCRVGIAASSAAEPSFGCHYPLGTDWQTAALNRAGRNDRLGVSMSHFSRPNSRPVLTRVATTHSNYCCELR